DTASLPATIAAALSLRRWQWMSIVNHLPRACAGPGKRPGIGVPVGRQVKSIGVSQRLLPGLPPTIARPTAAISLLCSGAARGPRPAARLGFRTRRAKPASKDVPSAETARGQTAPASGFRDRLRPWV